MRDDRSRETTGRDSGERAAAGDARGPGSSVLELGHVFEVLDHPRRRYLLYAMSTDQAWGLTDLARKVAAWEMDVPEAEVGMHTRDRVYLSLYHVHVPKLVEEGVVTFDRTAETLRPGRNATQVFRVFSGAGDSDDSHQQRYAEHERRDPRRRR